MTIKEFGDKSNPTIIWLHGGGLSWWSLTELVKDLKDRFRVVTPVIDGHGEDGKSDFVSIEESARKLLTYIDEQCGGKVYALGGLSLGAQIIVEVLSQRSNIADYAIIESALVHPIKGSAALAAPMVGMSYGLIGKRWFARLQAKALYLPETLFENYFEDSSKMSKVTLINIALSNGSYSVKTTISGSTAKVMILVGEKELKIMKKSALTLYTMIPNSKLEVLKHMGHGELGLTKPKDYLALLQSFLNS